MTAAGSSAMRVCPPPRRHSLTPAGAPSWGLRVVQWLLVLLLAWDQVGSPLHRHHHDSGVDGSALTASHDDGAPDLPHAEDADGGLHFSHAVMAVRPQPQLSPTAAGQAKDVAVGEAALALANAEWVADPPSLPRPDTRPATHSPHRSLPPAGRAPPLHA